MPAFPKPRVCACNGIELAVYEEGQGPAVILLHGFPELAWSWRHQLPALAAAGYRAIAPDLRGYGGSSKPPRVEDYRESELLADLTGLLDALGEESAVFVGHDWGALLGWQLALRHPERMRGFAALNIPFIPRPPQDPIAMMRERLGNDFYIVNFQDSDEADRSFDSDPRRFIDRMMRRKTLSRAQFGKLPPEHQVLSLLRLFHADAPRGEPLLNEEELDYYATAFAAGGFTGPINWYRNWSINWRESADLEQRVAVPALFIGAEDDVVVTRQQIDAMDDCVPSLEQHILKDCGHWTQQERPDEVNRLLLHWLNGWYRRGEAARVC